jgi:anion-transporting  ArsA/GET3 family ATPase
VCACEMDPVGFCTQTRVLIVAGKGGVGKTTVSAALGLMAADAGLEVLIVEVEGKEGLAAAFGQPERLTYEERALARGQGGDGREGAPVGELRARTLTADEALVEYLEDHGMGRLSRRLARTGLVDVLATAVPGIKDILVLGKVKQLERRRAADLIVLDAPAAGHAITFLTSASGLLDSVRVGPLRSQAQDVVDLLSDDRRCQVLLVTLPEEMPVNEVVDTAYQLEDKVGISLAGVVVNGLYSAIDDLDADEAVRSSNLPIELSPAEVEQLGAAARFRRARTALQAEQVARLGEALPLGQVHLPFVFSDGIGEPELRRLAEALAVGIGSLASRDWVTGK